MQEVQEVQEEQVVPRQLQRLLLPGLLQSSEVQSPLPPIGQSVLVGQRPGLVVRRPWLLIEYWME